MMQSQKTLFTLAVVLVVSAFLGVYGHAMVDDHGAEEMCLVCAFLHAGTPVGVVFSLTLFLISHASCVSVSPLFAVFLPVSTPGRSPPIA
jgi:hypothetical protein